MNQGALDHYRFYKPLEHLIVTLLLKHSNVFSLLQLRLNILEFLLDFLLKFGERLSVKVHSQG